MFLIKKRLIKSGIVATVFVLMISLSLAYNYNNIVETSAQVSEDTKLEWGIKRNDNHNQPDLGTKNKNLIDKYNGIAIGNKEKKYIYLTFDLGYEAGYTEKILDALKEQNVKATFFITAHYVNTAPKIVQRMIDDGHIVGNHTVNHKSMPSLSDTEIETEVMTLHQTMYEKYGYEMKYIRPPKGEYSERALKVLEKLGYKTVMWSFAYVDWNEKSQPSEEEAMNKIMNNLHNGEVMLLHGTSKTNANIMSDLIEKVKNEGYEIRSLDNFIL